GVVIRGERVKGGGTMFKTRYDASASVKQESPDAVDIIKFKVVNPGPGDLTEEKRKRIEDATYYVFGQTLVSPLTVIDDDNAFYEVIELAESDRLPDGKHAGTSRIVMRHYLFWTDGMISMWPCCEWP